jgi:hypothetical protein
MGTGLSGLLILSRYHLPLLVNDVLGILSTRGHPMISRDKRRQPLKIG